MEIKAVKELISNIREESYDEELDVNYDRLYDCIVHGGREFKYKEYTFTSVKAERYNSEWISVFKLNDKLYKTVGCYDSWNGVEVDFWDIQEVKPVEKTIIVYE